MEERKRKIPSQLTIKTGGSTTTPKSGGGAGEGYFNSLSSQSLCRTPSFFEKTTEHPIEEYTIELDSKELHVQLEIVQELPTFVWKITIPLYVQDNPDVMKVFMATIKTFQFSEITKNKQLPGWKPRDLYNLVKESLSKKLVKCFYTKKHRQLITIDTIGRQKPKTIKDRMVVYLLDEVPEKDRNLFLMLYYKEKQISKLELQKGFMSLDEHTRKTTKTIQTTHDKLKRVMVKLNERVNLNTTTLHHIEAKNLDQDVQVRRLKQYIEAIEKKLTTLSEEHQLLSENYASQNEKLNELGRAFKTFQKETEHVNQPHPVYHHNIEWQLKSVDLVKNRKLVSGTFDLEETKTSLNMHLLPHGYENRQISVDNQNICVCLNPTKVPSKMKYSSMKISYRLAFFNSDGERIEFTKRRGHFSLRVSADKTPLHGHGIPICSYNEFINYVEQQNLYQFSIRIYLKSTLIVKPTTVTTAIAQKASTYSPPRSKKPTISRITPTGTHKMLPLTKESLEITQKREPIIAARGGGSSMDDDE